MGFVYFCSFLYWFVKVNYSECMLRKVCLGIVFKNVFFLIGKWFFSWYFWFGILGEIFRSLESFTLLEGECRNILYIFVLENYSNRWSFRIVEFLVEIIFIWFF